MLRISALPGRLPFFTLLFAPVLAFATACGDTASVSTPPPPNTGGTTMEMGGTSNGANGGTGNTVGVGGGNTGGEGNDGGTGAVGEDSVCGNDKLEVGELCDDGNTKDNDGCSGDCKVADPDYLCTEGKGCVRVVTCGNGIIEGDEVCDDKNTKDGDGCSGDCDEIEDGFICSKPGVPCVEKPVCGNGVREQGEQCDDKNTDSGDGCTDECQLEDGYFCPPGQDCVKEDCGDGNRTPDEACDDGNDNDGDGCGADCKVETGFICSSSGCKAICGDGKILGTEQCDDNNVVSGDGCSAACKKEAFYDCTGEPSTCTSTIVCGDGEIGPGEVCDPGITGQEDCFDGTGGTQPCKGYPNNAIATAVCNNGVIEYMETCDGNVPGCTDCQVDDGWTCPAAGVCFKIPECGDGLLQAGEQCDLGLVSGPGCTDCQIDPNYFCAGEPSVCTISVCGDGIRAPDEECDDDDTSNGDGCSSTCTVEDGYACPPGADCLPICGDGIKTPPEECDLGNSPNPTACKNCKLQPGYKCGANGLGPCSATTCPSAGITMTDPIRSAAYIAAAKANAEPGEGCDDGNTIAGDGCGPTCQLEPVITVGPSPTVALTCGDGLKTGSEECDDGNTTSNDGCSSTCTIENGWTCSDVLTRPGTVNMAITWRDWKSYRNEDAGNGTGTIIAGGHPHFQDINADNKGMTGAVCTTANQGTCGRLDSEGKPTLSGTPSSTPAGSPNPPQSPSAVFDTWFRDTNSFSYSESVVQGSLPLTQIGGASSDVYEYASASYFPLDGIGLGNSCGNELTSATVSCCGAGGVCLGHDYGFTSELRYFFQYRGGETLTFRGDDDVWVYINGRLAVDVGGVHCAQVGRVVLGDEDSDCSVHGQTYAGSTCSNPGNPPACTVGADPGYSTSEQSDTTDGRFGLTKGGVYEIVLFHAERHTTASNFRLTLSGFLAPRSNCSTNCGDGIKAGSEMCDDGAGMPASGYGVCLSDCTMQFCGDKKLQGSEQCDNGTNGDIYGTSGCAPGCKLPAKCGDGILQANQNEECDKGTASNTGGYNGCTSACKLGPYCGDNQVTNGETCDTPGMFETYGPGKCNYNCQTAPYCGDMVRNGPEQCDGSMGCTADCHVMGYCGDYTINSGEQCDNGANNVPPTDPPYGSCTTECKDGPGCGDGTVQKSGGEECDDGDDNADDTYDGCTTECLYGPHCGDAIKQSSAGEACDNGFNEDEYEYPGTTNACGKDCTAVPYCGDGKVQSAFELCDDGKDNDDDAYDGCTTKCDWGPYCGDGTKNGPEQCDDGSDNKSYSADGKGCSYECKNNLPYCGDGIRNGPEQCDNGKADNDGSYGGCNEDCTRAPYCGDRIIQKGEGETCDDGPQGSLNCSTMCKIRDKGPR